MEYEIRFSTVGRGWATVEAASMEEAVEKANNWDVIPGTDKCIEWSFDELESVEEAI